MTAITISAPARQARRSTRPATRPETVRLQRARRAGSAAGPLHLTRRGRLVLTGLLLVVGLAASFFVGGVGFAGTQAEHQAVQYVTVTPGQTLWGLAGEVAPDADRRDTVAQIVDLNALPSSSLRAGQRIAVPVR